MQKKLVLLFFCLQGIFLFAQPVIDSVRPGIKSVKKMICGYSDYGDSTGLLLDEQHDYNPKGRKTKEVYRKRIAQEMIADMNAEEPNAYGYFYGMIKK